MDQQPATPTRPSRSPVRSATTWQTADPSYALSSHPQSKEHSLFSPKLWRSPVKSREAERCICKIRSSINYLLLPMIPDIMSYAWTRELIGGLLFSRTENADSSPLQSFSRHDCSRDPSRPRLPPLLRGYRVSLLCSLVVEDRRRTMHRHIVAF